MGVSPQTLVGVSARLGWRAPSTSFFAPSMTVAFLRAESGTLGMPAGEAREDAHDLLRGVLSVGAGQAEVTQRAPHEIVVRVDQGPEARGRAVYWTHGGALMRLCE
jgi:hypothetical protein